jgi:hypothetical protein
MGLCENIHDFCVVFEAVGIIFFVNDDFILVMGNGATTDIP